MGHQFFQNTKAKNTTETNETVQMNALMLKMLKAEKFLSNEFATDPDIEFKTRLTQMEEAIIKLNLNKMLEQKTDSMNGKDVSKAHTMWANSTKKHEEQQQVTGTNNNGLGHK